MNIGIIGAGQLGRMLWQAATQKVGLKASVYGLDPASPAADAGATGVRGSLTDVAALLEFSRSVDQVVIESEFLPPAVLEALSASDQAQKWTPSMGSLLQVQSKLEQKRLCSALEVPTSEWQALQLSGDRSSSLAAALEGGQWVAKAARGGYDGRGTLIGRPSRQELELFCERNPAAEVYLEKRIEFRRELAIVGCRDRQGQVHAYPLVESRQYRGVCERVMSLELADLGRMQPQALSILTKILEHLDWVGVLAIEFFETSTGELLVNEIAPRVHNTGHYTVDAARSSQFEVHLRAVAGLPLENSDFKTAPSFAMLNLLGPEGITGTLPKIDLESACDYGKRTSTPLRKLGHWNWRSEVPLARLQIESVLDGMDRTWKEWARSRIREGEQK
jgi:5-(carboxyamino)imidazole ribonucleotide synthase